MTTTFEEVHIDQKFASNFFHNQKVQCEFTKVAHSYFVNVGKGPYYSNLHTRHVLEAMKACHPKYVWHATGFPAIQETEMLLLIHFNTLDVVYFVHIKGWDGVQTSAIINMFRRP